MRRLLVVPAVLSLALGGALLTATSANAAVGNLVIASPTSGETVASRTVTFSGTANPNAQIRIHEGDSDAGAVIASDNSLDAGGNWSATYTYPDTAATAETVYVDGIVGGSGFSDAQARSFTLPAVAPAPVAFAVTNPTVGQVETSRTVAVSGTGTSGSTVSVVDAAGTVLIPGNLTVVNGAWSGTVTYADDAATAQTLRFRQTTGASGNGDISVAITLPAASTAPTETFGVTSPTPGQVETSRTVDVSGTGTTGSTVSVTDAAGTVLIPGNLVVTDGKWSGTVTYAADAATAQSLRFQQTTGGAGRGDITVNITLPTTTTDATVAAPVITSPKNGEHLTGKTVTFTGTGTPGSNILLVAVPTSELNAAPSMSADAAAEPADPTDPIVVDADGNWTVTLALDPNDYTAQAIAFLLDANGDPVLDANGDPVVSDPSNIVEFSLTAAATIIAPVTPAATGGSVTGTKALAFTGSTPAPMIGLGALLAAAGTAITLIARRRRSMLG
ncbi:hypothetical protein ASF23_16085 [Curtobacterium sp. Leaf261]|nr:hypothetical protein ASF23_16085 [Curtobacterium sp. Leaf261]